MAGDWIKVDVATLDKPEVIRMAELLNIKRDEMIGILCRFWVWLDRSSRNGLVTHMSRIGIDNVLGVTGFGACLESVGWAIFDETAVTVTVPNFDRHNGNPAKTRALGRDRKRRYDLKERNADVTQDALPEKRREEKSIPKPYGLGAVGPEPPAPISLIDEKRELWDSAKKLLAEGGMGREEAGAFIGKLVKAHTERRTLQAVRDAVMASPADAKAWLVARLQDRNENKQEALERRNRDVAERAYREHTSHG